MQIDFINYGLSFVEGFALIVSPCILPILPIMLSGSIEGGNRRPLGIIIGFVLTFALFTFFSRALVQHIGINLDLLREIAFALIAIFGLIMISDRLSEKFSRLTQRLAGLGANISANPNGGLLSGLVLGALVSLIWVPCGGPVLAAAIVQTAVQPSSWQSFMSFFFFALGSVIPMLLIALLGRKVIDRLGFLKTKTGLLRKIFGVVIIIGAGIAGFSSSATLYSNMPQTEPASANTSTSGDKLINGLAEPYPAPALDNTNLWINSAPLSLSSLKGKVVLVDFWTYSCINCVRTLPYLKEWYAKYHQNGLMIIGVQAPEFEFEKNFANVQMAVRKYGITYPVVLDNDYVAWRNYNNEYWPADYLIDKNGNVVYQHFGEGDYAEAENNIRYLLGLSGKVNAPAGPAPVTFSQTPETYLGYARAENFASPQNLSANRTVTFSFPNSLSTNSWALSGSWNIQAEKIISEGNNAAVEIHFNAKNVYAVMGSSTGSSIPIQVILNGKSVNTIDLNAHTLYQVLNLDQAQSGTLELIPNTAGAEFYTFTFGSN